MLSSTEVSEARADLESQEDQLPFVFHALSDTGRFRIFKLLLKRRNLCVTDVANVLGISVPAASQQLRIMELSGLVTKQRDGQMMCFCVKEDDSLVKAVISILNK